MTMCFSAGASFTSGVVLTSIGIATVREVKKPSQMAFASIPLLFGMQQIAEGLVWLGLTQPEYGHVLKLGTVLFLIMARVVWPAILPLSVLLMEEKGRTRQALSVLLAMGLSVSLYYTYCIAFLNVVPQIAGHHIQYISDYPESLAVPVFFIYFAATIIPLFLSSIKRTRVLGVLMFIACLITAVFFVQYLTSVWCFFAAIMSVVVYWILRDSAARAVPVSL